MRNLLFPPLPDAPSNPTHRLSFRGAQRRGICSFLRCRTHPSKPLVERLALRGPHSSAFDFREVAKARDFYGFHDKSLSSNAKA
jgi:hypothetical protein